MFLLATTLLFWLVYRDQNWSDLEKILREDVDYTWIGVGCFLGILSHISRAMRWQLLTESMGYRISLANSFMGVMIGYFANIALPRMGEFTRCGVVNKYEGVPYAKLLGTVVTERIIDVLILLVLTLTVIATQFKQIVLFLNENQGIGEKINALLNSRWIWLVIVLIPVFAWLGWKILRKTKIYERLKGFAVGMKEGILTVKNVKRKGLFIIHTVFIWTMYFLMFYCCFFCFEFTSGLGMLVALTVFVIGSYGMVAPVQGGIGAWHFMVIAALMIYLPHTPEMENMARTFALLTHGAMTSLYIVGGAVCLMVLPFYNARKKR